MRVRILRMAGGLAIAAVMAACGLVEPSGDEKVTIEGTVYGTVVSNPSGGPVTYVSPVNGAVVSTSLDAATATTNASGQFTLVTNTGPSNKYGCKVYTVTITSAGWPTYSLSGVWGSHPKDQIFALTQKWPDTVGAGITPC
jgi:hypothetical protein